jgi:riboflavin synthase
MFTGIVAGLGTVTDVAVTGESARVTVTGADLSQAHLGDSVAVDGVCLTAVEIVAGTGTFVADLLPETRRRSTLGDVAVGRQVNLELAATPTTVLGGHLVQGHVDGVGTVVRRTPGPEWDDGVVRLPDALTRYVVEKGSIALDGVSLTVVGVTADELTVSLIPETLRRTTLGAKPVGGRVNVEVDVIAKYVERLLTPQLQQAEQRRAGQEQH